jgi:hypothetical protein
LKNHNYPNMLTKKTTKCVGMKRRCCRLNQTSQESAHMYQRDLPISQPNLDISPFWTPVITAEVKKLSR